MAYKSIYTGAKVDELLGVIQNQQTDPSNILKDVTGAMIMAKLTEKDIMDKLTGQGIINKINTVTSNITFTKYVNCSVGAGKGV